MPAVRFAWGWCSLTAYPPTTRKGKKFLHLFKFGLVVMNVPAVRFARWQGEFDRSPCLNAAIGRVNCLLFIPGRSGSSA